MKRGKASDIIFIPENSSINEEMKASEKEDSKNEILERKDPESQEYNSKMESGAPIPRTLENKLERDLSILVSLNDSIPLGLRSEDADIKVVIANKGD